MAPQNLWRTLLGNGGTSWTRTNDLTLIKRLLYQLSYGPDVLTTIARPFIGGP